MGGGTLSLTLSFQKEREVDSCPIARIEPPLRSIKCCRIPRASSPGEKIPGSFAALGRGKYTLRRTSDRVAEFFTFPFRVLVYECPDDHRAGHMGRAGSRNGLHRFRIPARRELALYSTRVWFGGRGQGEGEGKEGRKAGGRERQTIEKVSKRGSFPAMISVADSGPGCPVALRGLMEHQK